MVRYLVVAAACALAAGCSQQAGGGAGARPKDTLDVYEAVFRYGLKKHPADVKAYVAVDRKDAPAELLKRLQKDWPNLKPASEEPKQKGLRVYAENLKWGAADAAEIKAGYRIPTKYADEGYFADHHVIRENGRWVVQKVTNETSS